MICLLGYAREIYIKRQSRVLESFLILEGGDGCCYIGFKYKWKRKMCWQTSMRLLAEAMYKAQNPLDSLGSLGS